MSIPKITAATPTNPPPPTQLRILQEGPFHLSLVNFLAITLFSILLLFLCCLYKRYKDKRIYAYYKKTSFNEAIMGSLKTVLNAYDPTLWLPGALPKIAYNGFTNSKKKQEEVGPNFYRRMKVEMDDGEVVALDVHPQQDHFDDELPSDEKSRTIMFIPGIFGHSFSIGCSLLAKLAWDRYKWRTVIFNRRGYCHMPIKSDRITSFDLVTDLKKAVEHLNKEYNNSPVYLVGISIGAGQIQNFLQAYGEYCGVAGAVCIASPWNTKVTDLKITTSRVVEKAMVGRVTKFVRNLDMTEKLKHAMIEKNMELETILKCDTSRGVYEELYVKDSGVGSVDSYHEMMSSHNDMEKVRCPLLCVNSLDDPVSAGEQAPLHKIELPGYENWIQINTGGGGHVEFFSGLSAERWIYKLVLEYFRAVDAVCFRGNQRKGTKALSEP